MRNIVAALLFFFSGLGIGYLFSPSQPVKRSYTISINDTIHGDSVVRIKYYPRPVPQWRDTGSTRWKYLPIDTGAILAEHFSRNAYHRVLKDDSSAYAAIYDTVAENRLTSFRFDFQNRRATHIITNTTTTTDSRSAAIYIGPSLIQGALGGSVQYTNDRWTISAGTTGGQYYVSGGYRIWLF